MRNFLRNFRLNLLKSGNYKKHIAHIFLEIILIFIGITLAIIFDNYRERNKIKKTEILLLKEMLNDEERNINDLKANLVLFERAERGCTYFLNNIDNEKFMDDSLGIYVKDICFSPVYQFSGSAYNTMNSIGWQIISNDSLRKKIIYLYDFYYDAMEELAHNRDFPMTNDKFRPLYYKHFDREDNSVLNYNLLKKDIYFKNVISDLRIMKKTVIGFTKRRIKKSEELQELILKELEQLE